MDDSEHVCPLCCEELDISDQQFFPCKCGYQVCMWCWHRIRESESGLCPACRTPYGDDPHEFSAVDVEEVLRANKEKEAAAKRERDRQRQESNSGGGASSSHHSHHGPGGSSSLDDNYSSLSSSGGNAGPMEVPKDRTQLANMRVIRRNLVYAVGLPPSIANEEILRKPEYFGQYGKISKIVLNRNQASSSGGDSRRSSCSAYVTFFQKEDTLACILALDGFYLEGRNIRASYGTSKYCSAFIKNVRCNNPECTYLHEMGAVEDTFTKQEIQAGYVTSGRDVLARQQQIVAQAQASGSLARKRSGGGGPSGTGRSCSNPVFPAPEFDEPAKPPPTLVSPPSVIARSSTVATGFSAAASSGIGQTKITRSSSAGAKVPAGTGSVGSSGSVGSAGSILGSRKGMIAATAIGNGSVAQAPQGTTAASVVAGMHSIASTPTEPPAPHTTLTPLTPLKRSTKTSAVGSKPSVTPVSSSVSASGANGPDPSGNNTELTMPAAKGLATVGRHQNEPGNRLGGLRNNAGGGKKSNVGHGAIPHGTIGPSQSAAPVSPSSVSPSNGPSPNPNSRLSSNGPSPNPNSRLSSLNQNEPFVSSLGGEVISAPGISAPVSHVGAIGSTVGPVGNVVGSGSLLDGKDAFGGGLPVGGLGSLGGEVFTGPLKPASGKSAIGSGKDKWNGFGTGLAPGASVFDGAERQGTGALGGSGGLWAGANSGSLNAPGHVVGAPGAERSLGGVNIGGNIGTGMGVNSGIGVGVVGGNSMHNPSGESHGMYGGSGIIGSHVSGSGFNSNNNFGPPGGRICGSSALASILGINLPTGSGSLRESSSLWNPSSGAGAPQPSSISSLNNGSLPSQGVIGPLSGNNNNSLIGGVPIVGVNQSGAFGNSNKNDIALLQSLLPGVHITSGNETSMGLGGWGTAPSAVGSGHPGNIGGGTGETWEHSLRASGGSAVGPVGQNNAQQTQRQGAGNIW